MAGNINDDSLDNPINPQSENFADKAILIDDTETITADKKTENMEVHHHPDLHHKSKTWKAYFLEFLMIFLAVTMGFVAENIREHFVLKKNEKEYMVSLVRDLNNDIAGLTSSEATITGYVNNADSIITLFKNADFKNTSGDIYYFGRTLGLRNLWRSNDGTIQQLIYSGGLKLIENKSVIDSIQNYISKLKLLTQLLSLEDAEVSDYRKAMNQVFSGFVFNDMIDIQTGNATTRLNYNPDLQSTAKNDINNLVVQIVLVKTNRASQVRRMEDLKTVAGSIIKLINKEYGLE